MNGEKVFRVTDEERETIKKLYSKTNEEIDVDIKHLKEWINKQPHLPQDDNEEWLKIMLYYNKFRMEKTKKKIDMYHSIKHIVPQYFEEREPLHPSMVEFYKNFIVFPLPNLNNLTRIYFAKFIDDGTKFVMTNYIKSCFVLCDLRMVHDYSIGETVLFDYQNITFTHIKHISPVQIKQAYDILQKAYSDKIMYLDFINVHPVAATLINVISSVLPTKFKEKIRIHKSTSDLLKYYSPDILPTELGGSCGKIDELYDEWLKFLKSKNKWVKESGFRRSDESKRIGEPLDSNMFGMCGSFKKLNVD